MSSAYYALRWKWTVKGVKWVWVNDSLAIQLKFCPHWLWINHLKMFFDFAIEKHSNGNIFNLYVLCLYSIQHILLSSFHAKTCMKNGGCEGRGHKMRYGQGQRWCIFQIQANRTCTWFYLYSSEVNYVLSTWFPTCYLGYHIEMPLFRNLFTKLVIWVRWPISVTDGAFCKDKGVYYKCINHTEMLGMVNKRGLISTYQDYMRSIIHLL